MGWGGGRYQVIVLEMAAGKNENSALFVLRVGVESAWLLIEIAFC